MPEGHCDGCRFWERDTHAVGECGVGRGITTADDTCALWAAIPRPVPPENRQSRSGGGSSSMHLLVPDTEGGTHVSLSLWDSFVDYMRSLRRRVR